jgi:hypothetical protein
MKLERHSWAVMTAMICVLNASTQEYTFSTFVGAASSGSADGSAGVARFNSKDRAFARSDDPGWIAW